MILVFKKKKLHSLFLTLKFIRIIIDDKTKQMCLFFFENNKTLKLSSKHNPPAYKTKARIHGYGFWVA